MSGACIGGGMLPTICSDHQISDDHGSIGEGHLRLRSVVFGDSAVEPNLHAQLQCPGMQRAVEMCSMANIIWSSKVSLKVLQRRVAYYRTILPSTKVDAIWSNCLRFEMLEDSPSPQ
jgi:hypothetical protein